MSIARLECTDKSISMYRCLSFARRLVSNKFDTGCCVRCLRFIVADARSFPPAQRRRGCMTRRSSTVATGCGLALGELIQDESEKKLLLADPPGVRRRAARLRRPMGPPQRPQGGVRRHATFPGAAHERQLSISGDEDDWTTFSRTLAAESRSFSVGARFRRSGFADMNFFARLRCTLDADQIRRRCPVDREPGRSRMRCWLRSTAAGARHYLVAVTTGGNRDLYFAVDRGELPPGKRSRESDVLGCARQSAIRRSCWMR